MSRTIKFRVWDKDNEVMHSNIGVEKIHLFNYEGDNITEQEGLEIMQYTGQNDRNGNEIYEGDVVDHFDFQDHVTNQRGYYCFSRNNNQPISDHELEEYGVVIGNIYESPELAQSAIEPNE